MSQTVPTPRPRPEPSASLGDDLDGGLAISPGRPGRAALALLHLDADRARPDPRSWPASASSGRSSSRRRPGSPATRRPTRPGSSRLRPKYGGWTNVFDTLGFFSIFTSIWFKGLVVLLTTSILACSVNRAPHLWKQAVHPRTDMSESFFEHAPLSATIDAAGRLVRARPPTVAGSALRRRRFRTVVDDDAENGAIHLYADQIRWGPFGTVIAHLSLVFILVGAMVGGDDRLPEHGVRGAGRLDGRRRLRDRACRSRRRPSPTPTTPTAARATTPATSSSTRTAQQVAEPDDPGQRARSATATSPSTSRSSAPAAAMKVADATGKVVYEQGVPLLWSSNDGAPTGRPDHPAGPGPHRLRRSARPPARSTRTSRPARCRSRSTRPARRRRRSRARS